MSLPPQEATYSCGACGYSLNLSAAAETRKKGRISFTSLDLSRFTQVEEVSCLQPVIIFSCGRRSRMKKTKLLCRECGEHVGYCYGGGGGGSTEQTGMLCGHDSPEPFSLAEEGRRRYVLKAAALSAGSLSQY